MNYEEIVKATVQAGLVQALNKDSEQLIQKLVNDVLTKKDGYYSSSFIDETIQDFITRAVQQVIFDEIETKRPLVIEAVKSKLTDKFFNKIIEVMSVGLEDSLKVKFTITEKDFED